MSGMERIRCPKCPSAWLKLRPASIGGGLQAFHCDACGKLVVLDIEPDRATARPPWAGVKAPDAVADLGAPTGAEVMS
jgi:hypothetical protein